MDDRVSLCIIDDIPSVVEGLAKSALWRENNIEVIGTACDGEEGLSLIRACKPDIVITDIRMPNKDGIELLTSLKEEGLRAKVIFFSGYTEFSSAQLAVRLGAFDYLTKPHSLKQIVSIVVKAKEQVLSERLERKSISDIQLKVKESMPILRQEFFNLLLHYPFDMANVKRRWEFLEIDLPQQQLAVLVVELDRFDKESHSIPVEEVELIRFSLQNIVEETVSTYTKGVIFRETMSRFVVICHVPEDVNISDITEAICTHIAQYTKVTVTIGYGKVARFVNELQRAYTEAITALSYQFYTDGNTALSYDDVVGLSGALPRYSDVSEQTLKIALLSGNSSKAIQVLNLIFNELSSYSPLPNPAYVISVYNEITSLMLRIFLENVPLEELQGLGEVSLFTGWGSHVSLLRLQEQMIEICNNGCQLINKHRYSETERLINDAVVYIKQHLHTDLKLQHCAGHVHLSVNYFANSFKKVVGLTFVQFLTQERMETAKRLLLEGKQVQDISLHVGYEDRRYFSLVFKKYTGLTPSEFKTHYIQQR